MTESFRPVLRTQADVENTWKTLMQPLGFSRASVWMLVIGPDDRPLPQITEIAEADLPSSRDLGAMSGFLRMLGEEHGITRVAFLRSRPGRAGIDADDREWAQALYAAAHDAGLRPDVVHLANDVTIVPIPRDELPAAG